MDSTQPDRDTELALPAENPNVGVSENPFDASSAIEQHIDWARKIGLLKSQSWQDAGQQGLTPTQGQILALLIDKGNAGCVCQRWQNILRSRLPPPVMVTSLVDKGLVQKRDRLR